MTVDRYTHPSSNGALAPAPDQAPVALFTASGTADLVAWAHQFEAAHRFASGVCNTAFVSQQYRNKPEEAAAAILAGSELGFSPMTALRGLFDNIQGVTAPRAITQRAVVQSKGHDVWLVEATDERCIYRGRRKGSETINESEWTIERAKALGLTSKDQWKKQPRAMLIARATSECCRLTASDALLGIPYSVEELRDDPGLRARDDDESAVATPSTAVRGRTRVTADDLTGDDPVDAVGRSRQELFADMKAAFDAASVTDRTAVTNVCSSLVGRTLTTPGDLTDTELSALIDQLADLGVDGITDLAGDQT